MAPIEGAMFPMEIPPHHDVGSLEDQSLACCPLLRMIKSSSANVYPSLVALPLALQSCREIVGPLEQTTLPSLQTSPAIPKHWPAHSSDWNERCTESHHCPSHLCLYSGNSCPCRQAMLQSQRLLGGFCKGKEPILHRILSAFIYS